MTEVLVLANPLRRFRVKDLTYRALLDKLNRAGVPPTFGRHDSNLHYYLGNEWHRVQQDEMDNMINNDYIVYGNPNLLHSVLYEEIEAGRVNMATALLRSGQIDLHPIFRGNNAFTLAIRSNNLKLVQEFVKNQRQSLINAISDGESISNYNHDASEYGSDEVLDYLLRNFKIYRTQGGYSNPLINAIKFKRLSAIEYLLQTALTNIRLNTSMVKLFQYVKQNGLDYDEAVTSKINIDESIGGDPRRPLTYAIETGDVNVIQLMLDYGARYYPTDIEYAKRLGHNDVAYYMENYDTLNIKEPAN